MSSFTFPAEVLAQHSAVLGKTGAGKSSTAKLIVEQVVGTGARVVILDPIKSDWWGLTSSADGNKPGLPFYILGGPRGHVPLHSSAGKAIGELVAHGDLRHSILDMADFEPGGQAKFFTAFAPALLRRMRGVVYLVMEEAHLFAPKERSGIGDENMAIHWAKMLATAGRSKGIRLILVTQRTQALHNALLGSCDTLIAHRLTAPADQEPVAKWLKANTPKDIAATIAGSLASLPTGTAWVASGEAKMFERVSFPRIKTYDNTATPTDDDARREVRTAQVDVEVLRGAIGEAVKEAEANDPRRLRAQVADLERKLAAAGKGSIDAAALAEAKREAFDSGYNQGQADTAAACGETERGLREAIKAAAGYLFPMIEEPDGSTPVVQVRRAPAPPTIEQRSQSAPRREIARRPQTVPATNGHATDLTGPQAQLLGALAWWAAQGHDAPTRAQVCGILGWRVTSGHVKNVSGSLKSIGLVDYPTQGSIGLTDAGTKAAPQPDLSASLPDQIRRSLNGPQQLAFDALLRSRGSMSRDRLCEQLGWNTTSGHIKNVLGSLRSLEVLDYPTPGEVELQDWVRQP